MNSTITPFLAGRPTSTGEGQTEAVRSPWDNRTLADIRLGTDRDLDQALDLAVVPKNGTAQLSRRERALLLERIADRLEASLVSLTQLIAADAGKPTSLARAEVERSVAICRMAAYQATRFGMAAVFGDADPRGTGHYARIERFPVGPIAAISPFNFPLNLAVHKVAPAIATGNPVILKAAPQAPLAAFELARIVAEAGAPPAALQVMHLPIPVAERFAVDDRFAMLSFTGSDRVGWHLKSIAGRKRVTLELGGNAAAVVHSDVDDLPLVARKIARGAFAYAGQICIKVQRLFVHQPIYDQLGGLVLDETQKLGVGDPSLPDNLVGPVIDDPAAERILSWVDEALAAGAVSRTTKVKQPSDHPRLIAPIVLEKAPRATKVFRKEVFGPVLVLERYHSWEDAIAAVNDSEYGLQAGIFTNHLGRIDAAFRGMTVGGVIVNDVPTLRLDHLPYGGTKGSGFGREGVESAMTEMTEERVLLVAPPAAS